ncbi:MAG TPA: hypothetical protein VF920_07585 [Dongiaceae bacterium]
MALVFEEALVLDDEGYLVAADDGDRRVTFFLSRKVAVDGMGFVASENEHMGAALLRHVPQIHKACIAAYENAPDGDDAVRLDLTEHDFS